MERTSFVASDGKQLSVAVWKGEGAAKAVAIVVHGMAEHIARYDELANYLCGLGFAVVGPDLRAHGETDPEALGKECGADHFERSVKDVSELVDAVRLSCGLPVAIVAHSYGSFLMQRFLSGGSEKIAAVVLSGCALQKGAAVSFGCMLAGMRQGKKADRPGKIFAKLTFGSYDRRFGEGLNGWLNRDAAEVGKYNVDPKCGFICSNGFYRGFFRGLKTIAADKHPSVRPDLPMMLIAGSEDRVGGRGKLVRSLAKKYKKAGLEPLVILYAGARHEVFNEIGKEKTFDDVGRFLATSVGIPVDK